MLEQRFKQVELNVFYTLFKMMQSSKRGNSCSDSCSLRFYFQILHLNLHRYKFHKKVKKFMNFLINSRLHGSWATNSLCQSTSWHVGSEKMLYTQSQWRTDGRRGSENVVIFWLKHSKQQVQFQFCGKGILILLTWSIIFTGTSRSSLK